MTEFFADLLRLAGLLSRSAEWRKNSSLRIIIPIDGTSSQTDLFKRIKKSLDVFRIKAEIILARNDLLGSPPTQTKKEEISLEMNRTILAYQSPKTAVSFFQLPKMNSNGILNMDENVLEEINTILNEAGPAVLGYGLKNVMTT